MVKCSSCLILKSPAIIKSVKIIIIYIYIYNNICKQQVVIVMNCIVYKDLQQRYHSRYAVLVAGTILLGYCPLINSFKRQCPSHMFSIRWTG